MPPLLNLDGTAIDVDGNGSAEPNESTSLLYRQISRITINEQGHPYYKDNRPLVRWPFLVLHLTYEILKTNYVNVLLVFVPLGIIAGALRWDPTTVFILNFLAIIPLASLLAFATEELSVPLGQTIGGLLNATFGNAVELIVRPHDFCQPRLPRLTPCRSASLRSETTRFVLSRPACLEAFCPTYFWSLDAALLQVASSSRNNPSTRPSHPPCLP